VVLPVRGLERPLLLLSLLAAGLPLLLEETLPPSAPLGRQLGRSFPPRMGIEDISAELKFDHASEPEASPGAQGQCLWPQGHEQRGTEAAGGPRRLNLLPGWMRIAGCLKQVLMDQNDGGTGDSRRTPPTYQRP